MKKTYSNLALIIVLPLLANLFLTLFFYSKFEEMASEYDKGIVFEEKAIEIESGNVVLAPDEQAEHFRKLAKTESGIAEGFRIMGLGALFWVFLLLAMAGMQVFLLRDFIRANEST